MVKRDFIRNLIIALIIILAALLLRIFVFSTVRIAESSANSYLHQGDLVTINKNVTPQYKDFVLYTVDGNDYVGRIVAEAGDSVTYMDDIFYLNNAVAAQNYIEEEKTAYLESAPAGSLFTEDFTLATIAKDDQKTVLANKEYLILNDNRRNTKDSREFGIIKSSQIKGVIRFRVLPLNQFGFIDVE
ncbi:signal peptidase I [Streptococcus pantholopis]|uniref:Signal peptidase I n=1 Tax=Streptococcus pantholopis TaxID=1811193 RepID=A0A172Q7K8_9STRE|nr:signal peptidase I [Streptococcus pantholopis]AND79430.1 signal peptidase I [Streptococcus pantholopis]